jgi:DNA polymerase-3 subunit delta'
MRGCGRRCMRELVGQPEATLLLASAAAEPSHAYILHGPQGAGKDAAARAFIADLLGSDQRRIDSEAHPDLFVLEPEGEAILIDQVRALRADLHLRPFEAERRAYLIREAESMTRDAANALLKSLEEPPDYAVFVLTTADRSRLLGTIWSRCQPVRFRTPAVAAIAAGLGGGADAERAARLSRGDVDLARRLFEDPAARERLDHALDLAAGPLTADFDAGVAAAELVAVARRAGDAAEAAVTAERDAALERVGAGSQVRRERQRVERVYEALARRRRRRAETDELRAAVDAITGYWRDVLCAAVGAREAVVSSDRLAELDGIAARVGQTGAEAVLAAAQLVRRSLVLPVIPSLALERLFHEIGFRARGLT